MAAQADGRTLGEWRREVILRGGSASDRERHDPALAEIVGVRLLLVNVLRPLAAGEKLAPGSVRQNAGPNQRSEARTPRQVAAGGPEETAARKKQRRGEAVTLIFSREPGQGSPLRSDERAKDARP
jgi:hypothetical protein